MSKGGNIFNQIENIIEAIQKLLFTASYSLFTIFKSKDMYILTKLDCIKLTSSLWFAMDVAYGSSQKPIENI